MILARVHFSHGRLWLAYPSGSLFCWDLAARRVQVASGVSEVLAAFVTTPSDCIRESLRPHKSQLPQGSNPRGVTTDEADDTRAHTFKTCDKAMAATVGGTPLLHNQST